MYVSTGRVIFGCSDVYRSLFESEDVPFMTPVSYTLLSSAVHMYDAHTLYPRGESRQNISSYDTPVSWLSCPGRSNSRDITSLANRRKQ